MDDVLNTIICGENEEVMAGLPTGSVDTIITDPPYGWSFMGKRWDYEVPSIAQFAEMLRVLKPGGTMLCFAGSRTQHRMACNVEDAGFILKDCIMWFYGSGFPKATNISKQLDKGHKRKVTGKRTVPDQRSGGINSQRTAEIGVPTREVNITSPATPEAILWNGWKSHGLKPAYEPIIVAMKCNEGSYANNALTHGVAGLNIDAGRIAFQSEADKKDVETKATKNHNSEEEWDFSVGKQHQGNQATPPDDKGRFPANVILDEQAAAMLDEQSGELKSGDLTGQPRVENKNVFGKAGASIGRPRYFAGDSGGASRFFYCAKASKAERNDGCGGLAEKELKGMNASPREGHGEIRNSNLYQNHHPTVKPLALMEYLCKLTSTPTGGIVLDPFAGSGTTLLAAYNTGRDYIGIERDPAYIKIIEARLAGAKEKLGLFEK